MPLKRSDMSRGQLAMIEDGFPESLILSQEERRASWASRPSTPSGFLSGNNRNNELGGETRMIAYRTDKTIARSTDSQGGDTMTAMPDYGTMKMEELVEAYNKMVTTAETLGIRSHARTKRFGDLGAGVRRCETIWRDLKEKQTKPGATAAGPTGAAAPQPAKAEKETDVAKKAKTAKKAAKKTETTKPELPDNRSAISKEFGCREGTNREKLLNAVATAGAKGIKRGPLLKATYGSANEKNAGAMDMVWKGIPDMIKKNRLGAKYEATREGRGEETTYALKKK